MYKRKLLCLNVTHRYLIICSQTLLHCEINQLDEIPVLCVYLDDPGVDKVLDSFLFDVIFESLNADPVTVSMFHEVLPERLKKVSEGTHLVVFV